MKKKLLITGASGFLGYHLLRVAAKDWEVYGFGNTHNIDFGDAVVLQCDITNYIALGDYFEDIEPDAVIHAAAIADGAFCQNNKAKSYEVNVEATRNLAGICCDLQIPFAFTSTDLVFDGKKGMYTEEDVKNPLSVYGEHKSIAEEETIKIYPGASVFRLPLMFGHLEASYNSYFHKFLMQLKRGEKANLFSDEYRSITGAKSISKGILNLLEKGAGVVHLGGPERLSRYEFGLKVAEMFNLPVELLVAGLQKDFKTDTPRPADVSLNIQKAISLGFAPHSVVEELKLIMSQKYC
ncbi:MAG: dTDP-4-dehydrorhamnose reductase [Bacteroidota bacterium]|nr:dTDP-4-dehydrorhamnose reductase [Bacteroidota bacterium]